VSGRQKKKFAFHSLAEKKKGGWQLIANLEIGTQTKKKSGRNTKS